jgi:putative ABC transport system substrate-binding protein
VLDQRGQLLRAAFGFAGLAMPSYYRALHHEWLADGPEDPRQALAERLVRACEVALKHRLPTMFGVRDNVVAGGLMSYAPDHIDLTRRAAIYIDKILKGAKPADLPVEQASKYELVINLKTAKALGLTIPQTLLLRADQVIQ